jgi:hypothetical protein
LSFVSLIFYLTSSALLLSHSQDDDDVAQVLRICHEKIKKIDRRIEELLSGEAVWEFKPKGALMLLLKS